MAMSVADSLIKTFSLLFWVVGRGVQGAINTNNKYAKTKRHYNTDDVSGIDIICVALLRHCYCHRHCRSHFGVSPVPSFFWGHKFYHRIVSAFIAVKCDELLHLQQPLSLPLPPSPPPNWIRCPIVENLCTLICLEFSCTMCGNVSLRFICFY